MEPLHDRDEGAVGGIVEPGRHLVAPPVQHALPAALGVEAGGVLRIVDDVDVAALAEDLPTDARAQPLAGGRVAVAVLRVLVLREPDPIAPTPPIDGVVDHRPALDRVAQRQRYRVGGAEEAHLRALEREVARLHPGPRRPEHVAGQALLVARRDVDQEATDLPEVHRLEMVAHRADMPVVDEAPVSLDGRPHLADELVERTLRELLVDPVGVSEELPDDSRLSRRRARGACGDRHRSARTGPA